MPYAVVRPDTLYAWSGPSLLVVNTRGECAEDQRLAGYYFREARFLRILQLRINGHAPWPCEAASIAPDTLAFTYVHPEITTPGGGGTGQAGDEGNTDGDGVPERALIFASPILCARDGSTCARWSRTARASRCT